MEQRCMRLPWISRLAYEAVLSERDRLREQVDDLLEHLQRVDRVEHGMSELPRQPRPEIEPIPGKLDAYIEGFEAPPQVKAEMRREARRRRAKGQSWDGIAKQVIATEETSE